MEQLTLTTFDAETLISESLSRALIEDESLVELHVEESFDIKGDLNYLSIALKNLIDNALKYGIEKPIILEVKERTMSVKSKGEMLEHRLAEHCRHIAHGLHQRFTDFHCLVIKGGKSVYAECRQYP